MNSGKENNNINYPTPLSRVQITREMSTNISQYLYTRRPVKQVSVVFKSARNAKRGSKAGFRKRKTLDNNVVCTLRYNVVSLYNFTHHLYFDSPCRLAGSPKYCKTRKNIPQYYTLKRLIRLYVFWKRK